MIRVAVVGPGRAGGARIRDLEAHPGAAVSAVVARTGVPTFADVLGDPDTDAVAICTPNALHADAVATALGAGKHVLVEFPLAPGAERAQALFERAAEAGRVLHVEHVELLSATQARQRERAARLGPPRGGSLRFAGGFSGWIADPDLAGSPALRAVARLHRLVDLFGPAVVEAARLRESRSGYSLEVGLGFERGGRVTLIEERGPGATRITEWGIDCERGRLDDPEPGAGSGLFERDLDCFLARVSGTGRAYVEPERIVHVLSLVTAIERALAA